MLANSSLKKLSELSLVHLVPKLDVARDHCHAMELTYRGTRGETDCKELSVLKDHKINVQQGHNFFLILGPLRPTG